MRKTKSKPKTAPQQKAGGDCPLTHCSVSLEFIIESGGKIYEGTVTVPAGPEPLTLPMMINGLMVNIARDCPHLHDETEMTFVARMIPRQNAKDQPTADAKPNLLLITPKL